MKNKRTTTAKTEVESKDYVGAFGRDVVAVVSRRNNAGQGDRKSYFAAIPSVLFSIVGAGAMNVLASLLFSDLPQIPRAYASLIAIVISSIVGISITFLFVRFIYQRRKAEREEVIHRVRSKEQELFEMLNLDFDRISRRRELDAGQTN